MVCLNEDPYSIMPFSLHLCDKGLEKYSHLLAMILTPVIESKRTSTGPKKKKSLIPKLDAAWPTTTMSVAQVE